MTRTDFTMKALQLYEEGKISADVADAMIRNVDEFCEEDNYWDDRLPEAYAEIEYPDMDTEEAYLGSRFDDINFMRYMER